MQPAAKKKRAQRARRKARIASIGVVQGPPSSSSSPLSPQPAPVPAASVATLLETHPVTAPRPDAFVCVPLVDGSKPLVPDASPGQSPGTAPAPALGPDDVALIANGVAWFFEFGAQALFVKNPQLFQIMPGDVVGRHFPNVVKFVRGSAERVAMKHGIALPYQDELVCAGALGLAAWGLAMTPANDNAKKKPDVRDVPKGTKNANPPTKKPDVPADSPPDMSEDPLQASPISTDGADDEEIDLGSVD